MACINKLNSTPVCKKPDSARLKALSFPTFKYRRYRGDMIRLVKIIIDIYDPACVTNLDFMDLSHDVINARDNK